MSFTSDDCQQSLRTVSSIASSVFMYIIIKANITGTDFREVKPNNNKVDRLICSVM